MDPYLERSDLWQGFHNRLLTYLCDALQPELPEGYVATLEVRVYLEHVAEGPLRERRVPDLEVLRSPSAPGGTALLERPAVASAGYWVADPAVEVREAYLTVRSLGDEELVTAVELLSPSNKRAGEGRTQYQRKQEEYLRAGASLVEVDLLRGGLATVAATVRHPEAVPQSAYSYCTFRSYKRSGYWVEPFTLRDALPPLVIPVAGDLPEPVLDLQALLQRAYAIGRFDWLLRHRPPLNPPLSGQDQEWVDTILAGGSGVSID